MSESTATPQVDITPADFSDAFDDWIATASVTKLSVPIYGKPGLAAEFQSLSRERQQISELAEGEPTLGESSRLSEIEERAEELYAEWQASKAEWIVQDVAEVEAEVRAEVGPQPEEPEPLDEPFLPRAASDQQKRSHTLAVQRFHAEKPAHDAKVREYERALNDWYDEYAMHLIARAVVEIRFADGRTAGGVSVEQLRKMRKQLGKRQLATLNEAVRQAMLQEPVIEAPFSQSTSQPDPT